MGGQVEQHIRFDEGAVGPVVEDELFVRVGVQVFVVEIGVEIGVHFEVVFVLGREDVLEVRARALLALLALLRQAFGPEQFGGWEGRGPLGDEDVVFEVGRDEVADRAAEGGEGVVDFGRQGCRGEDG